MENHVTRNTFARAFTLSALIGFLSISMQVHAINTSDTQAVQISEKEEKIEIITVTGMQPISFFRKQLIFAEDEFYNALNSLMEEDAFKIECESEKNSFSHITRRVCEPKYVDEIKYEMTQLAIGGRAYLADRFQNRLYKLPSRAELENDFKAKRKEHLAAVRKAVENDEALQLKLLNLNKARYSYNKKHLEMFGERSGKDKAEIVADTKEFVEKTDE